MVISENPVPSRNEFQLLIDRTLVALETESKRDEEKFLTLLGRKLEDVVKEVMTENAIDTPFENSIKLFSGQRFPDIVAKKFYGVEVKTTSQNHWKTTGNSIFEGTRVKGVERIYMLFGKMVAPIQFRCRPYEDCLSEVVVTHSPRYLINMDLDKGNTIFDQLGIPYDDLRRLENPMDSISEYYRQFLKPGEGFWWMEQKEPKPSRLIIRIWNNLPKQTRDELRIKAMILFPEIFGRHADKFNRLSIWFLNEHGLVCPNVRDVFTSGGQGEVSWKGRIYRNVPKVIVTLIGSVDQIKTALEGYDDDILEEYWKEKIQDKKLRWISLVVDNIKSHQLPFDLGEYLNQKL